LVQQSASASILFFSGRARDWSQQELAEFYRVENALSRSGLHVSSDRGTSDEGDPWFIFFRVSDNEPLVHFARIDGVYIIASAAYDGVAKGKNFREMILDLLSRYRLNDKTLTGQSNIFFHPAALLITLVGVAFFKTSTTAKAHDGDTTPNLETNYPGTNGVTKKKELAVAPKAKSSTAFLVASEADERLQTIAPAANDRIGEMSSVILSAIAELSLIETGVAQVREDLLSRGGLNASEAIDASFTAYFKNSALRQPAAIRDDTVMLSAFSMISNYSEHSHKADAASNSSDAVALFELLNSIPTASAPIHLRALFKQSSTVSENTAAAEPSVTNSRQSYAGSTDEHIGTALLTKTSMLKTNIHEKEVNTLIAEQIRMDAYQVDASYNSLGNPTSNTTMSLATIFHTDPRSAFNPPPSLALNLLNQFDQSFRFADFISASSASTNSFSNDIKYDSIFASILPDAGTSQKEVNSNYLLTVVDNKIQLPAILADDQIWTAAISSSWGGEPVESLLRKLLQTFTETSFAFTTDGEFIFRTPAEPSHTENIRQITISFEDGSIINIIGAKQDIDYIMS